MVSVRVRVVYVFLEMAFQELLFELHSHWCVCVRARVGVGVSYVFCMYVHKEGYTVDTPNFPWNI
jgi:hypothetical protein